MRIAICGKMCSGKSTLAEYIKNKIEEELKCNIVIDSFAKKVYDIAYELFNMKEKNRKLLQSIGTKMREIDPNVWANYIENKYNSNSNVIIDDLRYENEATMLKKNGFFIIKLEISHELQHKRIKDLYKSDYNNHIKNINHQSENSIDNLDDCIFDLIINVDKDNINKIIQKEFMKMQK